MRKLVPLRSLVSGVGLFGRLATGADPAQRADALGLYADLKRRHARSPFAAKSLIKDLIDRILRQVIGDRDLPPMLKDALAAAARDLVAGEAQLFVVPSFQQPTSLARGVAFRAELRQRLAFFADDHDRLVADWLGCLIDLLSAILARLPHLPSPDTGSILVPVPLALLMAEPQHLVAELVATALRCATNPVIDRNATRPGARLAETVVANLLRASRLSYAEALKRPERLSSPLADGDEARTVIPRYLGGTPLATLALAPVPLPVTQPTRFEHTHIVAGTGVGKTQTLQQHIVADLSRPPAHVPALVVVDSKGAMLKKIARLALFEPGRGALAGRLVLIDPTDIDHPPALNLFDLNTARMRTYGRAAREQILNSAIELFDYIFGALLDADLTQKQRLVFRYLARLIIQIPGGNIHTLRELLDPSTGNELYHAHADKLPPSVRAFFDSEFLDKQYIGTRRQVLRRLWGILENPTLERMLAAPRNRVDLFDALNRGGIVLVNTARDFLKDEKSSFLGRIFIAMTLQAVFERAALPEHARRPTFLYIDEASEYFDGKIDDLLTQARQHNCGLVLAHQYLDQLSTGALKASIAANTAIKMAAGVADEDARALAPNMRCTPEFIARQMRTETGTTFAIYVRNLTPTAVALGVPFGTLEAQPTMSEAAYARLIAANRARLSAPMMRQPAPRSDDPHDDDWRS